MSEQVERQSLAGTSQADASTLPTFLIIGAQKSGTSSLWAYLRQHPQVFLPDFKEPGFFVEEVRWHLGLDWYRGLFAGAGDAIARGEASTFYTMYPYATGGPERMAAIIPDVRLIYLMRDPIQRMRSAYVQALADGLERRKISEALLLDPRYVSFTRYALQAEQYLDWFPRDQMLFLTAEDLKDRREETLKEVQTFVGVTPASLVTTAELNRSENKRALRATGRFIRRNARSGRLPGPLARRLVKVTPRSMLSRPISSEQLVIPIEVQKRLIDLVRPDIERMARYMPASFDGWGLLRDRTDR